MRAVVVTTHAIQYQAPLFRRLASNLDLKVVFLMRQTPEGQAQAGFGVKFEWDIPLVDGYEHLFARNVAPNPSTNRRDGIILEGHERLFDSLRPDALLQMGWFPRAYLQVLRWAERAGVPVVCRGESNLVSGRSWPKRLAKAFYFRWLFRKFRGFSVIGRRNHDFYRHYGVPEARLHFAPYSVDTDFFERELGRHRQKERPPGPWRLGLAGKLISKKRPMDFLLAAAAAASRDRIRAVFIGDGPLREELEANAHRQGLSAEFRGFLNQSEIVAKGYADLDALVLPSGEYETWGLVVNEAMTGGIPAIVSDMVGCAPDLVQEDRTGYVFRSGDVAGLTRSIDRLVARLESGHDFAPAVHERIALYSIARTVSGVEQALRAAAA
jgi:glycosyltransferase involved in cell wall biosynthesis